MNQMQKMQRRNERHREQGIPWKTLTAAVRATREATSASIQAMESEVVAD